MVDLSVLGIVVREESNTPFLLLHPHGTRQVVSLRLSSVEAFAVSMALDANGVSPGTAGANAPGTPDSGGTHSSPSSAGFGFPHDLIARLVETLGGRLLAVELLHMADKESKAEAVLKAHSGIVRLECRPVDAILLALRCGVLIRMPEHLLSYAEDMDAVVNSLPEHVRAGIADRIAGSPETDGTAPASGASSSPTDPRQQIISAAKKILDQHGLRENLDNILTSAKKTTDARTNRAQNTRTPKIEIKLVSVNKSGSMSANTPDAPDAAPAGLARFPSGETTRQPETGPGKPAATPSEAEQRGHSREGNDPRVPRIRIALVRQSDGGDAEIVDEFHYSAGNIPREVLASLGLSPSETAALNKESSADDRWATLLRILAPETKVLM